MTKPTWMCLGSEIYPTAAVRTEAGIEPDTTVFLADSCDAIAKINIEHPSWVDTSLLMAAAPELRDALVTLLKTIPPSIHVEEVIKANHALHQAGYLPPDADI
nr:hypothetical protein [uncultured Deefgea sp.]